MEQFDTLKPNNEVTVRIWGPQDSSLYQSTGSGFHTIEMAVNEAISAANLQINPQDCVFEVTNQTTGVSHRYRLNAHNHLKLII